MKKCIKCGKAACNKSKLCEICSLKKTSYKVFDTENNWQDLARLIEKQKFICPYTGFRLKIGTNASIDHKIPRVLGGGNEINNLEWVHLWVNKMKYTSLQNEFEHEFDEFLNKATAYRQSKYMQA